jgi:hypothetical protein
MNRRELLKSTCAAGACACLAAWGGVSSAESASGSDKPKDWQIDFLRARLEDLLAIITTTLDEPTQATVLAKLGRACGKQVVKGYEGNPDAYWAHIKTLWLERVEYDKATGVIHLTEKARTQCNCPLAALMKVPGNMCFCSVGTQEGICEALFNRPAKATVDESVLRGGKRCSFTVTLQTPKEEV